MVGRAWGEGGEGGGRRGVGEERVVRMLSQAHEIEQRIMWFTLGVSRSSEDSVKLLTPHLQAPIHSTTFSALVHVGDLFVLCIVFVVLFSVFVVVCFLFFVLFCFCMYACALVCVCVCVCVCERASS